MRNRSPASTRRSNAAVSFRRARCGTSVAIRLHRSNRFYTVVATEAETPIVQGVLNTFPARIPVKAGDQPAIWITPMIGSACYYTAGAAAGDVVAFRGGSHPEPAVGSAYPTPTTIGGSALLDLSAQLEPDVDGDGFGDETQDSCPQLQSTQVPCPAPETTITKSPRKLKVKGKKRAKAKFEFSSDSAGATFACSLDGAAAAACTSPYTAKVKKGSHTFTVVATSALGVADATSATSTFKVKKKKRKKK